MSTGKHCKVSLTGNHRYIVHERFMRTSLIVLQVEVKMEYTPIFSAKPIINTYFRDAKPEDIMNNPRLFGGIDP